MDFSRFLPAQAGRLRRRYESPAWRAAIRSGLVDEARATRLPVPPEPNSSGLASAHLVARNEAAVRARIAAGERDRDGLIAELAGWRDGSDDVALPGLSFLGLCLTWACNASPKCLYCNQRPTRRRLALADWKRVVDEAADSGSKPYIYLTGGEPLLWQRRLYGPDGLIRHAAALGCPANVNTNALRLSPATALRLVSSGLAKIHISLDSANPEVHDAMSGVPGRWERAVAGIENLLIARELLGGDRPILHLNCVLTRDNAWGYPELVRWIVHTKPQRSPDHTGGWRQDPFFRDLGAHLVPVGGEHNAGVRLTAPETRRFYEDTWPCAAAVWEEYQEEIGVTSDDRVPFGDWAFFASAWLRVRQSGDLAEYAEAAAVGNYARLALGPRCHIVPTQAFVLPDGSQYWCGAHYIARPEPVGNVLRAGLMENIRQALSQVRHLPGPYCGNCATATLFLNQGIEGALAKQVDECLEAGPTPTPPT
ncbi:MAG: radical SAM protein [Armatimonadetes bacterium]|nr:radical SAM protein [Armatimonadota bacterium]